MKKPALFVRIILACLVIIAAIFAVTLFFFPYKINFVEAHAGKFFLDVNNGGDAWYVHPLTNERYFVGTPNEAKTVITTVGLGVTSKDLEQIPLVSDSFVGDLDLRKRLSGRIILDIENALFAWYIDPDNLQKHQLGVEEEIYESIQNLGLPILNEQLEKIPDGVQVALTNTLDVPFTPQSPFAEWDDLRQQEGCEEASTLMAIAWARGENISLDDSRDQIIAMAEQQKTRYGAYVDTSAQDTVDRLFNEYFDYMNVEVRHNIAASTIREELSKGNLVLIPVDGKALRNDHFVNGGPERHMLVVTGFDWETAEFITNEPGTKRGKDFRYSYETIRTSLRDYPSGNYVPIPEDASSAMIIVRK